MSCFAYHKYVNVDGASLFTVVCLPEATGKFPTLVMRSPYVDDQQTPLEQEIVERISKQWASWAQKGYAVVFQHCRGRGKSSGDCIPYIYEREDGLTLQAWIREQSFYNGELYLYGHSYTSSVHFVTAPFAPDIKGAVLQVQDCNRYNCNYRNGFYKIGLHGRWYVNMYKRKSISQKNFATESFHTLPLSDFSKTVLGEPAADFDEILRHPDANDPFWNTRYGGGEAKDAIKRANIPILLVTGLYDIYTGGVFDMWNGLDESTKAKCALIVHPLDHGCNLSSMPLPLENATLWERFGSLDFSWLEYVRGKADAPVELGKVTYYQLFGNEWRTDDFRQPERFKSFPIGEGEKTYRYNPYAPASFQGGLSANFDATAWQAPPNSRYDIISFYTPEFTEDTFVKGKMKAKLRVRSTAEDTCFYVRISLAKEGGDLGLRDDINQISNFCPDYIPGEEVDMEFSFDEHAFVVKKGEKLRVDVSSSAFPYYVRHTNRKGLFSEQTTAESADNTVLLEQSFLTIFYE